MYAVIKTGGKQYRVAADDVIEIEKIAGEAGETVTFDQVMMIGGEDSRSVGTPVVDGAQVSAEVIEQKRGPKIIIFKKIRRQNYRRKNGHRQELTKVRILEILAKGEKATKKTGAAAPKPAKAAVAASDGDNLSLLSGVGPALEKKLHDYGIFHFSQIAAMSAEDAEKMDGVLKLGGRMAREDWAEQARELMAGKAPRAKVDQKTADNTEQDDAE